MILNVLVAMNVKLNAVRIYKMKQLILVRGIPGSGKSTLARNLVHTLRSIQHPGTVSHFEADMYFEDAQGNYNFDAFKLALAHGWCLRKTREALEENRTVIVSNTFTTVKELKPYFALAKEFGIVPVVYLAQNQFQNVHNVPADKLQKMRDRFQYDISELFVE
jgi:tRNA uridine 5-carbamoylmethylation protein Kti12